MIPYHIYMSHYNYLNYNTYHVSVGSIVRIISTSTLVAIDDKYIEDLDPVKCFCECNTFTETFHNVCLPG